MQRVKTVKNPVGNSLAVQWLGLRASIAGATDSIPGWGTKMPHAMQHGQKKKKKKRKERKKNPVVLV